MQALRAFPENPVWSPAFGPRLIKNTLQRGLQIGWATLALAALGSLLAARPPSAGAGPAFPADGNTRKAIMMGSGDPVKDPAGHPLRAKMNFLRFVGNLENDPRKGWTCDFDQDLKIRFGMDPRTTSAETLFNYIGQHHLGYRIAMNCGPAGQKAGYWRAAVDNGIMPFGAHDNNYPGRVDDDVGIRCAVSVAGGITVNVTTYGPSVEFIEAMLEWGPHPKFEDTAQSWASQGVAVKFARVLDAHPNYNIWDAREYLRQAGSFWASGWTETNGYGRVNEKAVVGKLLPGPPVDFQVVKSRDRHQVFFDWHNFLQTDFAATVIARSDGRIIYEGTGSNFVWNSDVNGDAAFTYWSRNRAGERSRIESYQRRAVKGLNCGPYQLCLLVNAMADDSQNNWYVGERFQQVATNWVWDMVCRTTNGYYDPRGHGVRSCVPAVLPDLPAMVGYAISNHYRILLAPILRPDRDLYAYKDQWDRATAAGILVVGPHSSSLSTSRAPRARRLSPPRLSSAITVGEGADTNHVSFGPGLEFFDRPTVRSSSSMLWITEMDAAAVVAGKLAQILDANPRYNLWDARQHLRQSASNYASGWVEDGGYGRPPPKPASIAVLDPAPPIEIQAVRSAAGDAVTFSWQNFLQSSFAETVIQRKDGRSIYHGTGTRFVWRSDVESDEVFHFFSKDKAGRLSRPESYAVLPIQELRRSP